MFTRGNATLRESAVLGSGHNQGSEALVRRLRRHPTVSALVSVSKYEVGALEPLLEASTFLKSTDPKVLSKWLIAICRGNYQQDVYIMRDVFL